MLCNKNACELSTNSTFCINNQISAVSFSQKDFDKIVKNLNSNKAHSHENIRVHTPEIYAQTICKSLEPSIFKEAWNSGLFPWEQKIETSFLTIKKMINKTKILASIFINLNLREDYKHGEFWVGQLFSSTHKNYKSSHRNIFFNISKALIKYDLIFFIIAKWLI